MNFTLRQKESRIFAILILSFFALIIILTSGCGSIQKEPRPKLSPSPKESTLTEEATADPDELPPPDETAPPSLIKKTPPSYKITHIPSSPRVKGKLDVPIKRKWNYIVVHHSGTQSGNAETFDQYHKNQLGWLGVGYHFVIGNGYGSSDGKIEATFRWEDQIHGAHAGVKKYNQHGIGICLVGNFDSAYPTEKQIKSLAALVSYLQDRCHIPLSNIYLHRQIKNTNCPGAHFPYYQFISLINH